MKYLNLLKKYWLLFLIIFALLLGYFLNLLPRPKAPSLEIPKTTPIPTIPITSLPTINTGFTSPNQITWRLTKLDLPKKLPVLHIALPKSDPTVYFPAAKAFGLTSNPTKIPNLPIIVFNSPDNSGDFYVNLKDRLAKFQINLDVKPLPQTGTKRTPDDFLNQLTTTLTPILNLPTAFSLRSNGFEYETINGEGFTAADQTQANLIQITLNYEYNHLPIKYRGLPTVTAKYSLYGPLISLSYALPPSDIQPSPDYSLKTFNEIKQTPANQFEIVNISGNLNFTLSDQNEIIKSTTITDGYLGYLMSPNSTTITPYVFFTGTSQSKIYGPLTVTLATPTLKLPNQNP